METFFTVFPIGWVRKKDDESFIEIEKRFADALLGLDGFSHIHVFYWFHQNDTVEKREILRVHPRRDPKNPLTGVFATHSPVRPNLIGFSLCRILAVDACRIRIDSIDALDGSPVIDIKCFIPDSDPVSPRLPNWI